ncbi:hypothetical protein V6N13_065762 [Hibiscus sabdariffa]|uniref:Uncharacterized protein n=1 Tax=Hibiscus sabdariffa TaxID=183260 RepID=A0ABR1Z8E0_9ROSI
MGFVLNGRVMSLEMKAGQEVVKLEFCKSRWEIGFSRACDRVVGVLGSMVKEMAVGVDQWKRVLRLVWLREESELDG